MYLKNNKFSVTRYTIITHGTPFQKMNQNHLYCRALFILCSKRFT
jgi:hypothetical protein